jgi:splicing factor 3B subunit 3
MGLSTRSWLLYNHENRYHQDPLSYDGLESAADITSEMFSKGLVGVTGSTLKIFTVEHLGGLFNQISYPLRYTPRKFIQLPRSNNFAIIETDHLEFNSEENKYVENEYQAKLDAFNASHNNNSSTAMEEVPPPNGEEEDESDRLVTVRGAIPGGEGKWASAIRILDGRTGVTHGWLELSENEAAFSICTCQFTHHSEETFLIVGTAKDLQVSNRQFSTCYIHVYRMIENTLQLIHKTEVEEIPQAMIEFQGKLLVGIGRSLRLYELGKKKLLKKTENKSFPSYIVRLQCNGDRIYVGDLSQSIIFVKYRKNENILGIFADDSLPK